MSTSDEARDAILNLVRAGLADLSRSPVAMPLAPRVRRSDDSVTLFESRVNEYRATTSRCSAADTATFVMEALGNRERIVVPADLSIPIYGAIVDGDGATKLSTQDLDAVEAVVTDVRVAIAETGTVVLDHDAGQGRRAISLLPDLHVCIVRANQIVPDVPDALALLDPTRPQTWISGPSATSDIELTRVEGVHGPRALHVIIVA